MYVLDTDTFSLWRAGHPPVTARVRATPPADVSLAVITVEEVLGGWYTLLRRAAGPAAVERAYRELGESVRLLAGFPLAPYTRPAMTRYDALLRLKLNVRKDDLRIAAVALEFGATVVTRNGRDFGRVPGLAVEDWSV